MKKAPGIQVQLVHIDGSLKGEIQEFYQDVISIGRHPDSDVVFPKDDTCISRKHAVLVREGNRYRLDDNSANGTMVNGKFTKKAFLKNGDVLIFGDEGPKVSFLSTVADVNGICDQQVEVERSEVVAENDIVPSQESIIIEEKVEQKNDFFKAKSKVPLVSAVQASSENKIVETVQKSLVIQYGATLKAFNKLPVTIGSGIDCDFIINDRSLLAHHLQIFFKDEKYWVKDLTGRGVVLLNNQPVENDTVIHPDTCLALSPEGPQFQFLGDGRLAEISNNESQKRSSVSSGPNAERNNEALASSSGKRSFKWLYILVILLIIIFSCAVFVYFNELSLETGAKSKVFQILGNMTNKFKSIF